MHKQLYLLTLAGGGDLDLRAVEKDVWEWVMTGEMPLSVKQKMFDEYEADMRYDGIEKAEDIDEAYYKGMADNDRALNAPAVNCSYSISEHTAYLKTNDVEIVKEYTGYIY